MLADGQDLMRLARDFLPALALTALAAACGDSSNPASTGGTDAGGSPPSTTDSGNATPPVAFDGAVATDDSSTPIVPPAPAADAGGDDAATGTDAGTPDATPTPPSKTSLIWIWQDYANALNSVTQNASSFTHVSPALYQLNYAYSSGVATLVNTNDNFSGLSSAQFAQQAHAAGLKCVPLMYAGAGNFGTDQGIQNVLNDSPAGAQSSFITSMVNEGVTKGYDGYNLDWEVSNTDSSYSDKLVSFLAAFKSALNAHGMILTLDVAGWYTMQCSGSGGTGLVDLTKIGPAVDQAIIEDYSGAFNDSATSCPAKAPSSQDCDSDFGGGLTVMCNLPPGVVSIGLISTGTNAFADRALARVASYGYTNVAVWPDDSTFLNGANIPAGATWYTLLAGFLGH